MNFDQWFAEANIHIPLVERFEILVLLSDSAQARNRRLIRTTVTMCTRCESHGIPYDALREFVNVLEGNSAATNYGGAAKIHRIFVAAQDVVRRLAALEKAPKPDAAPHPSQESDGSPGPRRNSRKTRPLAEKVQRRHEAILRALPASTKLPLKNQTALRQAMMRQAGGLNVDSTTISRDLKHLESAGEVEKGILRRTLQGDARAQ